MRFAAAALLAAAVAAVVPAGAQVDSVKGLLQLARRQSSAGHATAALESLGKARALAPNSEEVLHSYAQLALAARLPVPAIGALEPLARMCPTVAQYHYLLGIAFLQAGAMPAATDALREAERLAPDDVRALVALGLALNSRKLHGEARSYLARSIELDPENADGLAALAEAEEALGDGGAEVHAARALALNTEHATANYVTALISMRQQRYAEARDALLRALAADPAMARAHYQASLAYARLGDDASARRHIDLYRKKMQELEEQVKILRQ